MYQCLTGKKVEIEALWWMMKQLPESPASQHPAGVSAPGPSRGTFLSSCGEKLLLAAAAVKKKLGGLAPRLQTHDNDRSPTTVTWPRGLAPSQDSLQLELDCLHSLGPPSVFAPFFLKFVPWSTRCTDCRCTVKVETLRRCAIHHDSLHASRQNSRRWKVRRPLTIANGVDEACRRSIVFRRRPEFPGRNVVFSLLLPQQPTETLWRRELRRENVSRKGMRGHNVGPRAHGVPLGFFRPWRWEERNMT